MKKRMHYLDIVTSIAAGGIDRELEIQLLRSGRQCRDGCGGIPEKWEGQSADLRFVRKLTLPIESAPRAEAIQLPLWKILLPYMPSAIQGSCEFTNARGLTTLVDDYVSVYLPVLDRVCLRGVKKYDVCTQCGSVKCRDFDIKTYLLAEEIADRPVVMSMSRGILVNDAIRKRIEAKKFRSLRFYEYEVREKPLDGLPLNLDDWPRLKKWRKPSRE